MDTRWTSHNLHRAGRELFGEQDPTLRHLRRQALIYRPGIIDALPYETAGVYTLGGGRQVGKTTLVKQVMQHLLEDRGVAAERITYLTCELVRDGEDLRHAVLEAIGEETVPRQLRYLFVDEVTYVAGWDRTVKFLRDAGALDSVFLLLTGSDLVLIRDAMKRLPGRRGAAHEVDFHYRPIHFLDFCRLRGRVESALLDDLARGEPGAQLPAVSPPAVERLENELLHYQVTGGYLTAINDLERDGRISKATIRTYSDWIRGDVLKQNRGESYLREILGAVDARYSSQVTWNALSRDLSIDHPKTVSDYCALLERMDAVAIVPALREDRLGPAPKKARKLYFTDPFIHHASHAFVAGETSDLDPARVLGDAGFVAREVEATLLNHLKRVVPTYYIKGKSGEVDAAYVADDRFWPIEVKWSGQIRPEELRQIARYDNGIIAGRVFEQRELVGCTVLPAPVVLLRISSWGDRSGPGSTAGG